jgi:putative aldouronate transport system substrate-binding protein
MMGVSDMPFRTNRVLKPTVLAVSTALALSACSGGNTGSENKTGAVGEEKTADKKYSYTLAGYQFVPVDKDAEILKYWMDKFNVELKPVEIDIGKYDEILNLKFASGEIPDVLRPKTLSNFQKYVSQDLLAEIPLDVLKKNAPNLYKMMEEASPGSFKLQRLTVKSTVSLYCLFITSIEMLLSIAETG